MTSTTATRRAMFGILAAPVAALALPTACYQAKAADRSAWDQAVAAYDTKEAAYDACEAEFRRACERFKAASPSEDMIHWEQFQGLGRSFVIFEMDVEERWRRFQFGEGIYWSSNDGEAEKRTYRAALDSVLEYRRLRAEAMRSSGYDAAYQQDSEMFSEMADAEEALFLTPAPHIGALHRKLNMLFGEAHVDELTITAALAKAVLADAERLAGEARA